MTEAEQRAHWDAVLADIEQRIDQVRQIKPLPLSFVIGSAGLGAALLAAGGVVGGLLVRVLSGHG